MRSSTILLSAASSCLVQARWMRWTDNREAVGHIAQPTQASGVDESNGWTPKPTQAPGSLSASEAVLELLKRASSSSSSSSSANTWENNQSCGWYAGISCKSPLLVHPTQCGHGCYEPRLTPYSQLRHILATRPSPAQQKATLLAVRRQPLRSSIQNVSTSPPSSRGLANQSARRLDAGKSPTPLIYPLPCCLTPCRRAMRGTRGTRAQQ